MATFMEVFIEVSCVECLVSNLMVLLFSMKFPAVLLVDTLLVTVMVDGLFGFEIVVVAIDMLSSLVVS